MRVIAFFLILCIVILSGCAKKGDNIYNDIGETLTTEEIKYKQQSPTEEVTDNDYSIDKEMVKFYIDDSHFYDIEEGIDFAKEYEEEENFHIKVLNAYISDSLEDFGEYFFESKKDSIEDALNWCKERREYSDLDMTYMCVQIELTNKSTEEQTLDVSGSLKVFTRIKDERGLDYNLADKYISFATAYNEFWCDSANKRDEGKGAYFTTLSAGETITASCVYIMRKEFLDDELYFNLHWDEGEYNIKYNCVFPPNAETTKFIKINLK